MRGAVRLSALMGLPVVWVWTHDSVGLGEDGPTHQPVEHYAALRAIPHLWVIRPGDAERDDRRVARGARTRGRARRAAALATEHAGARPQRGGPGTGARARRLCAVGLSRRGGLHRRRHAPGDRADRDRVRGGADAAGRACARRAGAQSCASCRCRASSCSKRRRRTTATRCCRRRSRTRLAVEPGASISWWKWVGLDGDVLGLDRFGASAPGTTVLEELGFSSENILARASALLESKH